MQYHISCTNSNCMKWITRGYEVDIGETRTSHYCDDVQLCREILRKRKYGNAHFSMQKRTQNCVNGNLMYFGVRCFSVRCFRERNVLFNDALNTFYLRLYGVRHMVKDHSDSEKGNLLLPHRLLFPINSKDSFICTIPQTG